MEKKTEENDDINMSNVKNKKKGKVKVIQLIIFLLIIAVVGIIVAFIVNKEDITDIVDMSSDDDKIVSLYYENLKKYETDEMYKETDEWNFTLYKMKSVEYPVLVAESKDKEDTNYCIIYYIKDDKVIEKKYSHESKVECLFNTDKEEYGYYLIENDGITITYTLLNDLINEVENPFKFSVAVKDNDGARDGKTNETIKIIPTDEHFIKVSGIFRKMFMLRNEEEDIKKELKNGLKNLKYLEDLIDSDIENDIKEKLAKIRKQQEEVKEYKEKHGTTSDTNTSNNSSLTNTNLNNNSKTENNSTNSSTGMTNSNTDVIQVGKYTIKIGTYKGKAQGMDGSYYDVILKINENNLTIDGQTLSYSIKDNYIIANGFEMFQVNGNNSIQQLAGDLTTLTYQE